MDMTVAISITVWNAVNTHSADSSVGHDSQVLYLFIMKSSRFYKTIKNNTLNLQCHLKFTDLMYSFQTHFLKHY